MPTETETTFLVVQVVQVVPDPTYLVGTTLSLAVPMAHILACYHDAAVMARKFPSAKYPVLGGSVDAYELDERHPYARMFGALVRPHGFTTYHLGRWTSRHYSADRVGWRKGPYLTASISLAMLEPELVEYRLAGVTA